jgi:4-aminobutyrate aminotransferase-like enzyme/Ser/Thr protein kinase RdoA (MazF antagonist)/murein DD-endopeptidase MepM/ murein hydrolase activator NlpD
VTTFTVSSNCPPGRDLVSAIAGAILNFTLSGLALSITVLTFSTAAAQWPAPTPLHVEAPRHPENASFEPHSSSDLPPHPFPRYNFAMRMPESRVAPPVSPAEATRLACTLYGIEADARLLPGEYDDNFHLISSDSREFVLKVMHSARELAFVDMQCRSLSHLARRAPHLSLPRVCPTLERDLFTQIQIADGTSRFVWLLTFLPGTVLALVNPHSLKLLESLGRLLAEIDVALLDFSHPFTRRDLKWDLTRSLWAREFLHHIKDRGQRDLVASFLDLFEREALAHFPRFRRSVIYGDANDYNVLVSPPWPQPRQVISVIDFGDMHESITVAEPAIAAAYAILGQDYPLSAATAVLAAYHRVHPLTEAEIAAFFPLVAARLAVSVINSAHRKSLVSGDPYVTVTEAPAWAALERLAKIHPRFAHYTLRMACGLHAVPQSPGIQKWLAGNAPNAAALIPQDIRDGDFQFLDLSVASTFLSSDPVELSEPALSQKLQSVLRAANATVGIGRYDEPRPLYSSPLFGGDCNPLAERRTVHLGIDLFMAPGTPICAPFAATVHAFANNSAPFDFGPVVILHHNPFPGLDFFTLYGHLSTETLSSLQRDQCIARGEVFAHIGHVGENGGWPPHLHFQIVLDLLDRSTDFPGVAFPSERFVWTCLSPDPNLILGIPDARLPKSTPSLDETLASRRSLLGKNLSISYSLPLKIVRGWRQYLFDDVGRAFLDVYNNVPLVGHSHPRVVRAVQGQLATLNTNTRYLHDNANHYAERLIALLPAPLGVCFFVNSGSEANELALRLARAHSGREDILVLEHAYHGHTNTLTDISPYKFNGPGGRGQKPWVHVAPIPDEYRGLYRRGEQNLGQKYAARVAEILEQLKREGRGLAAYIAETLPSVAGQIVLPPGYLSEVYKHVRAHGGVCIADEVQVGFGRLGTHFWGFTSQQVVPDIVVFGKPIGNAFPLAAVVTTPEIATSFANGMEFFSTFGGNPVACAAGLAVLDVLRDEQLQQNALEVGSRWIAALRSLQSKYPLLGDVRGSGLFLGLDLVNDRDSRAPATEQASYVVNRLRDLGILAGTDGPHQNVIKLRPPLIFSDSDAALFTSTLSRILAEDPAAPL